MQVQIEPYCEAWPALFKQEARWLRSALAVDGHDTTSSTCRLVVLHLIEAEDSLVADPGQRYSLVLSNPPFARASPFVLTHNPERRDWDSADPSRAQYVADTAAWRVVEGRWTHRRPYEPAGTR